MTIELQLQQLHVLFLISKLSLDIHFNFSVGLPALVGGAVAYMVSALVLGASVPGSSPCRGHCVVFLGKTLNSYSASLHPGV